MTRTVTKSRGVGILVVFIAASIAATPVQAAHKTPEINGACGSANGSDVTSAPTTNLCSAGSASAVHGSGPFTWTCRGSHGGTTATCSAELDTSGSCTTGQCSAGSQVNGACGSANGVAVSGAPTANLCTTGTASSVSGAGPWSWSCAGSNGGSTALCSAPLVSSGGNSSGLPSGVTLSAIDGETLTGTTNTLTYFSETNTLGAQFNANSAWLNSQIILGVWEEQPQSSTEVGYDVAMGSNLYVNLAGIPSFCTLSGVVDYPVIKAGGMHIIAPCSDGTNSTETVGWLGGDEPDLNLGPGSGGYNNTSGACTTSTACGYTAVQLWYSGSAPGATGAGDPYPINKSVVYTGDGKGVLQFESDAQAGPFLKWSDISAADNYWFTDGNDQGSFWGACQAAPSSTACTSGNGFTAAQAELAANYESNVNVLRHLQQFNSLPSKPIIMDVETGCPFTSDTCVIGPQFTAAAWHVLIAGARGIIWFQHNFGGACGDFNTFYDGSNPSSSMYDCTITGNTGTSGSNTLAQLVHAVTTVNDQITALAPVLLSPFAGSNCSAGGTGPGGGGYVTAVTGTVCYMVKYYNGVFYVFAGSGQPGTPPPANQSVTFTLTGSLNGTATVVNENRTISIVNGQLTDTFANANTVHIYQIN
jgi:hypothetical protein